VEKELEKFNDDSTKIPRRINTKRIVEKREWSSYKK
jgi:hypothetical protein